MLCLIQALSLVSPLQTIFMLEKLGERCMKLCMDNLLFLLALDKESMYRSMYNCVGLAEKLLNILHTENGILRSKAAHMLSYFSYCDCSDITEDLFNRNIIEHLWEGYQRFLPNNDFSKHILNILSNLADNEHNSEVVARHPIFSFIIGQFISADSVVHFILLRTCSEMPCSVWVLYYGEFLTTYCKEC